MSNLSEDGARVGCSSALVFAEQVYNRFFIVKQIDTIKQLKCMEDT